jgi:hypothetical protein
MTTSTVCPDPLFLPPRDPRPRRPEERLEENEGIGRDVEWISVSSRSSTRVFGRSVKAGLRDDTGVGVRVACRDGESEAGNEMDCGGDGSGSDLMGAAMMWWVEESECDAWESRER